MISGVSKGESGGNLGYRKPNPLSSLAVWGVRASRLRCPVCASPTSGSLPTDRCTRLCSACSAAGSAEQRGHTEGPRRLFGYFLAGEKVSTPFFAHCKFAVSLQIVENVSFLPAFLFSHGYAMTASPRGKPRALRADAYLQQFDKLKFVYSRIGYELSVGTTRRELTFFLGFSIIYYHIIGEEFL